MHLKVKQNGRAVNEFRFAAGPINIGRGLESHVLLPDVQVSRRHAVIFQNKDKDWIIEDLHSANGTVVNGEPVHKNRLVSGDRITIGPFVVEVDAEDGAAVDESIHLEDTSIGRSVELQVIARDMHAEQGPDVRLGAKRLADYIDATEAICSAKGLDELLGVVIDVLVEQFGPHRIWCALRNDAIGPMTVHAGRAADGDPVKLADIKIAAKIDESVEKGLFMLMPRLGATTREKDVRSAMIAPIKGANGCFGVIYIDNDTDGEPYSLSDLDYLTILAIHTAGILLNF